VTDIDWTDLCDIAVEPEERLQDLRGQGLTLVQLNTIQDVTTTGDWL
jgi:hypothetical protein